MTAPRADHDDLDAKEFLDLLESLQAGADLGEDEGLCERKKRRLRHQISNTATALFLAEGFDGVSVARIAAACEVSEQTVFNYFSTKESMFFDQSEDSAGELAEAVRHRGDEALSSVVSTALLADVNMTRWSAVDEAQMLRLMRRFCKVADDSPTLRAAPYVELPTFIATIAAALAERTGADVDDPKVEFIAVSIAGLRLILIKAISSHAQTASSLLMLEAAVRADIVSALQTAAPALDAFDENAAEHSTGHQPR